MSTQTIRSGWLTALLLLWSGLALAESPINTTFFGHVAIDGYDVVAYQTEHKALKGSRDFTYEWQGAKWRFASAAHLAAFKADPERYAPQYGGYCAYAMARGEFADIDPDAFSVIDGKLYLNYSQDIQKTWNADRQHFIEQADREWPKVKPKP